MCESNLKYRTMKSMYTFTQKLSQSILCSETINSCTSETGKKIGPSPMQRARSQMYHQFFK